MKMKLCFISLIILTTLWIGSNWWFVGLWPAQGTDFIGISNGVLCIECSDSGQKWHLAFGKEDDPRFFWWPYWLYPTIPAANRGVVIILPLWLPNLPLVAYMTFVWRKGRRRQLGKCKHCGYSTSGLVTQICPECGTSVPLRDIPR